MWLTEDQLFDAIGFLGGLIISSSLIPQIYRIHKTRESKDISYTTQAVFITGLSSLLAYNLYSGLWPVVCSVSLQLLAIIYLITLKTYMETVVPKQSFSAAVESEEDLPLVSETGLSDPTTNQEQTPPDASSVE